MWKFQNVIRRMTVLLQLPLRILILQLFDVMLVHLPSIDVNVYLYGCQRLMFREIIQDYRIG